MIWRALDLVAGGLFIWAGVLKALDPGGFAEDIFNYRMLPWTVGLLFAFLLPWLEIFCGLALVLRRLYAGALATLLLLVIFFTGATVAARARGLDISCGCFGKASMGWNFWVHVSVLAGLFGLLLLLAWRHQRAPGRPGSA